MQLVPGLALFPSSFSSCSDFFAYWNSCNWLWWFLPQNLYKSCSLTWDKFTPSPSLIQSYWETYSYPVQHLFILKTQHHCPFLQENVTVTFCCAHVLGHSPCLSNCIINFLFVALLPVTALSKKMSCSSSIFHSAEYMIDIK